MMFDIVDEIFDEHAPNLHLENLEWNKTKEALLKDGLREGIAAGKEKTLQTGFNMGYEAGYQQIFQLAALRGVLSAVGSYTHLRESEDARIKDLIKSVTELEKAASAGLQLQDKPSKPVLSSTKLDSKKPDEDLMACKEVKVMSRRAGNDPSVADLTKGVSSMTVNDINVDKELEELKKKLKILLDDLGMPDLYPNFSLPEDVENPQVVNV